LLSASVGDETEPLLAFGVLAMGRPAYLSMSKLFNSDIDTGRFNEF
jgi:hypothetical protein